jgi:hypothetical protein
LWTNIHIEIYCGDKEGEFEKRVSLLGLQFFRARGRLLDVRWTGDRFINFNKRVHGRHVMFLQFLRLRAPFSRWRSLVLELGEIEAFKEKPLSTDVFTNLERLTILEPTSPSLVYTINKTATSKLQHFDLRRVTTLSSGDDMAVTYGDIIRRVSGLSIHQPRSARLRLPTNITDLHAEHRDVHIFPHITSYRITICMFTCASSFDLRSLTNMTVSKAIELFPGCHVTLPSLQHLDCANIFLSYRSLLEAPNMVTARFSASHEMKADLDKLYDRGFQLGVAITHPGYLLFPRHSVTVELPLEEEAIITLLEQCPEVEKVSLNFQRESRAFRILGRLFEDVESEKRLGEGGVSTRLCPWLSELRLHFSWTISGVEIWKRKSSSAIEGSKGRRVAPSIYGSWEGEGVYVLLA